MNSEEKNKETHKETHNEVVDVRDLTFEAGQLCLDFANTMDWHVSDRPVEYLNSYADVVEWSRLRGVMEDQDATDLLQAAARHPAEAAAVLDAAVALREAIFRIFAAVAEDEPPDDEDLRLLNAAIGDALAHVAVMPAAHGFEWRWVDYAGRLDWVLWPVARSAAELLTSDLLARVKMCEDDRGCGVLFVDTSRNRSRRWCSMESCGNRAKVQRHRARYAENGQ